MKVYMHSGTLDILYQVGLLNELLLDLNTYCITRNKAHCGNKYNRL